MRTFRTFLPLIILVALPTSSTSVGACPLIENRIDRNCDQHLRVGATGDSIVRGVGDEEYNNKGGYVRRLRFRYPFAEIENIGVPGVTTNDLLRGYKKNLSKEEIGTTKKKLANADYLLIDVGRNDYFMKQEPGITVRNIVRLVRYLRNYLRKTAEADPVVAVATLLPTNRLYQKPFIDEVNRLLLKFRGPSLPIYLRFDGVSNSLIGLDGLHPTSAGYEAMTSIAASFLDSTAQELAKRKREDRDQDGVYDRYETVRFHTSIKKADSDGDGLLDGAEIFQYKTNPLSTDTDGDGIPDQTEIAQGTDPGVYPAPSASPTPSPTPTPAL